MRKLIVGLFLFVYYGMLLLSVTIYMHVHGFCLAFVATTMVGCLALSIIFCIIVTFGRYAQFSAFSKVIVPSIHEYVLFVLCSIFFHAGEFWFLRRAVNSFVVGKIMIGIIFVLIDFGTLSALLYLMWKSSADWTFLKELYRLQEITEGCDEIEIVVAYSLVSQQYEEPEIRQRSICLDGNNNGAIVASAVIELLKDISWRRKAFVVLKGGLRYSYLVAKSLRDFYICPGYIEAGEMDGGIEAMLRCGSYIFLHEYWRRERHDRIGYWDFWILFILFSRFWGADERVKAVIEEAKEVVINKAIQKAKGVASGSDCYSVYDDVGLLGRYLRGCLYHHK